MIEDEEEKLEQEIRDLEKQIKEAPEEQKAELAKKIRETKGKLCKLLDYDMLIDAI